MAPVGDAAVPWISMSDFTFTELLPLGPDATTYRKLDIDGVSTLEAAGRTFLQVEPRVLTELAGAAMHDIAHFLRPGHLAQLARILDDPEASANDRFVALDLLKNANIAAGGILPMCQDTGTAIVMGKRGQQVLTDDSNEPDAAETPQPETIAAAPDPYPGDTLEAALARHKIELPPEQFAQLAIMGQDMYVRHGFTTAQEGRATGPAHAAFVRLAEAGRMKLDYLQFQELEIFTRFGSRLELDVVARSPEPETLVFVEVRARRSARQGGAAASVGAVKQRALIFAARCYLMRFTVLPPCRFDVVAIDGDAVEWLQGVFGP